MIVPHTAKDGTRSYLVRVGRKPAKTFSERQWGSRKRALAEAKKHEGELLAGHTPARAATCEQYTERFLVHLELEPLRSGARRKESTLDNARTMSRGFVREFGLRQLTAIGRDEARDWALSAPAGQVKFATQLFNRAIEERLISYNPFRGLTRRTRGRADLEVPSDERYNALLAGWDQHGDYAVMGRALQEFAANSGMRPGEIFALEWEPRRLPAPYNGLCSYVDLDENRIYVNWRVYNGRLGLPKSNKPRRAVLTPPARAALETLVERFSEHIFIAKRGGRLAKGTFAQYWAIVLAAAGLEPGRDTDFYFVTKHRFVHYAYVVLGMSENAIAQQCGWSADSVRKMIATYAHADQGWEDEWERAYRRDHIIALPQAASA